MTNAHVATANVGHRVKVEHEQSGRSYTGIVERGAYSNSVSADWSLLRVNERIDVQPVPMSKDPWPRDVSAYTKGFPRCRAHSGTDIRQYRVQNNGVVLWLPNAIGGQSGSAVWEDTIERMIALLTWSFSGRYGGGQLTSEIYRQNRVFQQTGQLTGFPKMDGLTELDTDDYDEPVLADGLVEGMYSAPVPRGISDAYPEIWYSPGDPDPPTDPPTDPCDPEPDTTAAKLRALLIDQNRAQAEFYEDQVRKFQDADLQDPPTDPGDDGNGCDSDLFGLPPL